MDHRQTSDIGYKCSECGNVNMFKHHVTPGTKIRCIRCDKTFIQTIGLDAPIHDPVQQGKSPEPERAGSLSFYHLLDEMSELHERKSHDYASRDNPAGNYHFAGMLAGMFAHSSQDAGFVGRIGEKLYRLANLEASGKAPRNESVEDTERDICVITCLWMADRRDRRKAGNPLQRELLDLITLMPDSQTQEIMDYITSLRKSREHFKQQS